MKKILLLMAVCSFGLTGCAVRMSTSIKTVSAGPETVRSLPLTADLNISEQKVRGEAYGKVRNMSDDEDRLIREAVARALGQDPPKAEAPDVLVGMNVYKEQRGKNLSVVVTGYPGWYQNFRTVESGDSAWLILTNTGGVRRGGAEGLPVIAPGRITLGDMPKKKGASGRQIAFGDMSKLIGAGGEQISLSDVPNPSGVSSRRYYLGANMMVLGSRSATGEWICLEGGLRGKDEMSYGLEVGGGFFGKPDSKRGESKSIGGGFNVGRTYDLPADAGSLVYGVSAGVWYGYYNKYQREYKGFFENYYNELENNYLFGGPFIKARWKFVELSYKGLCGVKYEERKGHSYYHYSNGYYSGYTSYDDRDNGSIAWVSQLKLGVHFKL